MRTFNGAFIPIGMDYLLKMLQNDPYLLSLINGRAYTEHIATLGDQVSYPCITMISGGPGGVPWSDQIDYGTITLDVWSKVSNDQCWQVYSDHNSVTNRPQGVRALFHNKGFVFPEVQIDLLTEVYKADGLFDTESRTHRLTSRYMYKMAGVTIET